MVFPVVGGTQDTGYEISNSLRFNDDDSPSMTIASLGSSSSNAKKWTVSFWAKLSSGLGGHRCVFSAGESSGGNYVQLNFTDGDELQLYSSNALGEANNTATNIKTNAKYRDISAWYHVVWAIDTTQSTNTNRIKLYVNGAQVTSFATANNYPAQNTDNDRVGANNIDHFIGKFVDSSSQYFDGYLSDFYFIDGDAKSYTDFGETNDNGVWIPKKYTGTFGNNGFKMEFQQTGTSANSSGIGADTSGNDHHFSVSNLAAINVTEDTPTNNFATLNSIGTIGVYNQQATAGVSNGNLEIPRSRNSGESDGAATANIAFPTNGKWYYEFKWASRDGGQAWAGLTTHIDASKNVIYYAANGNSYVDNSSASYGDTYTVGDIISVAVNKDDNQVTFYKNGTSQGTLTNNSLDDYDFFAYFSDGGGSDGPNYQVNFGNPIHSISSGNSDANGYGNFEYAVPSGYYALCTKNLAEYG